MVTQDVACSKVSIIGILFRIWFRLYGVQGLVCQLFSDQKPYACMLQPQKLKNLKP